MKIKEFVKDEFNSLGKWERMLFPLFVLLIAAISLYLKDNKIAIVYAVCGISYTLLAGNGKIYCYLFGLISTLCYSYISFKNGIYGNFGLNLFYYFPMQIFGIFTWKKHLKEGSYEVKKTKLSNKERIIYMIAATVGVIFLWSILNLAGDSSPAADSVTTVFSILGLLFTVKRCIEQWYVWTIVNGFSVIMWLFAYMNGSHCFAAILTWLVYFVLGLYFLKSWHTEIYKSGKH